MGRGDYRNYYKGHMDKIKGEGGGGGERWFQLGWGGGMGRKGTQLYLNNNTKLKLKINNKKYIFIVKPKILLEVIKGDLNT